MYNKYNGGGYTLNLKQNTVTKEEYDSALKACKLGKNLYITSSFAHHAPASYMIVGENQLRITVVEPPMTMSHAVVRLYQIKPDLTVTSSSITLST